MRSAISPTATEETLTLIQGVLNTFVMFLARVVGYAIDCAMRGNREQQRPGRAT